MLLKELCEKAGVPAPSELAPETVISGISQHSRQVVPGDIFCCVKGDQHDGHDYAPLAVQQGAVALLCEHLTGSEVPEVLVADVRHSMAHMAAVLHGHPSKKTDVIGITGTNGKTTVAAMLAAILGAADRPMRTLGTLAGSLTTPDALSLQADLAIAAASGKAVVMEVSSHGLLQQRIEAVWFRACAFTNLSQDHLDYHPTMEDYFRTKQSLFGPDRTGCAVVNIDSSYGQRLAEEMDADISLRTCSRSDARAVELSMSQSRFVWEGRDISLKLPGSLALENAVTAATLAQEMGVDLEDIEAGLATMPQVPGRFEIIRSEPSTVIVDFAHTPKALLATLRSCVDLAPGADIIVVFGCGGDRDKTKRVQMGEAASKEASRIILTNDNPRNEPPEEIVKQIATGIVDMPFSVELDRRSAIQLALSEAKSGDIVLIAGKGHEQTQQIGTQILPFDDRSVALEESQRLWGAKREGAAA